MPTRLGSWQREQRERQTTVRAGCFRCHLRKNSQSYLRQIHRVVDVTTCEVLPYGSVVIIAEAEVRRVHPAAFLGHYFEDCKNTPLPRLREPRLTD